MSELRAAFEAELPPPPTREQARVLVLDIETRPPSGYVWRLHGEQHIALNQLIEVGGVICFAAKWTDEKKIHFHSVYHDGKAEMLKRAWTLIDTADAVVTYNGRRFDIPKLRGEFTIAGFFPPRSHKDIDLYLTCRQFGFDSAKLEHVATLLDIGHKEQTGGFDLWRRCMEGDAKAWATMRRYNIQDVRLTEDVYLRLRPWVKQHPNFTLYIDGVSGCPICGEKVELAQAGYEYTKSSKFQVWRCGECGGLSRTTARTKGANRVPV